jgi:PAS domain S-box-containing protein
MESVLSGSYDYWLVALSFVISVITSWIALDVVEQVKAHDEIYRVWWLLRGALAIGSGMWCMHSAEMFAFRPGATVYYHLPTLIASLLLAIVVSGIALTIVSQPQVTRLHIILGGSVMAGAIAATHFVGMASVRLSAVRSNNPMFEVLSVVPGAMLSFAGFFMLQRSDSERGSGRRKLGAALALGLAIAIMHFAGLAEVSLLPANWGLKHAVDRSHLAIAVLLVLSVLILAFAVVTSLLNLRILALQSLLVIQRTMLRELLDNIPDLMYVKDRESRFVLANPPTAYALGAQHPRDLIGKTEFDFIPAARAEPSFSNEQNVMQTGMATFNREDVVLNYLGDDIPVLTTTVPLRDNNGYITGIAGVAHDISERKKTEEALAVAERNYRGMFDQALFGIFQVDLDGYLTGVNPAMAFYLLYESPEEMLATQNSPLWTIAVSPERSAELQAALHGHGHVKAFELQVLRKDQSKIWISTTVRAVVNGGKHVGFEGMFEDVTERRLLRDQLLQAQKLESVGQLAAGIAHEINTPTQYIGDNVRFLKKSFASLSKLLDLYERLWQEVCSDTVSSSLKEEMQAALKKTKVGFLQVEIPKAIDDGLEGVKRVSSLVNAMKEFSHPGANEKVPLDLNHAIQSTIAVAQNEWKYVAEMETDLDPTLPMVSCLPGEFNQVILNLIVNAAHAIGDRTRENNGAKGKIGVRTARCANGVEIRISDTGTGIPEGVRAKIFDPFFTTKEIGKGTGQGLAIARSVIVDKHQGSIDFETVMGQGTTFVVRLPHVEQAAAVQG